MFVALLLCRWAGAIYKITFILKKKLRRRGFLLIINKSNNNVISVVSSRGVSISVLYLIWSRIGMPRCFSMSVFTCETVVVVGDRRTSVPSGNIIVVGEPLDVLKYFRIVFERISGMVVLERLELRFLVASAVRLTQIRPHAHFDYIQIDICHPVLKHRCYIRKIMALDYYLINSIRP